MNFYNNIHSQSQITLYRPMILVESNGSTKTFRPVDTTLAGFTTKTECDKMVVGLSAKFTDKKFETIATLTTYAQTFKQYSSWRDANKADQDTSFNKGCIEDIKEGLYLACGKNGSYVGTYNNEDSAHEACRSTGVTTGEEKVAHQKAYTTYRGYQIAKSRTAHNSTGSQL